MAFVLALVFFHTNAEAAVCRIQTKSAGKLVGKGHTRAEALEDARLQCFDRSAHTLPKEGPERETAGLALIDECSNYDQCEG